MARSYEILPMGLPVPAADVAAWGTARVAQAFALGFSLAAPFVIAGFAYNLALGAINRAMPQLMVAFIGAPAITAGGLLILMLAAPVILHFWGAPARPDARRPAGAAAMSEDERQRREGLRPDAAAAGRGAAQGRHPALGRRHRRGDLPRRCSRSSPPSAPSRSTAPASVLMVFIAQPDRLTGRVLGPGGPALSGAILAEALAALAPLFLVPIARGAGQPLRPAGDHLLRRQARAEAVAALAPRQRQAQVRRRPGSSSSPRRRSSSPRSRSALFFYLARDLDRMIGAATAEAQVLGAHDDAVAGGAPDHHLPDRGDDRRASTWSGSASTMPAGCGCPTRTCARRRRQSDGDPHMKAQRRSRGRGDRHQPDAARRAEGRRGDRQPDPLRGGAEMDRAPRARRRSASPRARARWRCASARSPRPPASRCTATRRPRGRCIATVEIGREIAPEHYRAVAAAIRFADRMRQRGPRAGPAVTPAALRRLAAPRRGAQGARPRAARRPAGRGPRGSRPRSPSSRGTPARDLAERRRAAAGAAGAAAGLGRPAHPRRSAGAGAALAAEIARRARRGGRRASASTPALEHLVERADRAALQARRPRRARGARPRPSAAGQPDGRDDAR